MQNFKKENQKIYKAELPQDYSHLTDCHQLNTILPKLFSTKIPQLREIN